MSEIKGQLLGIILVLTIFAGVSAAVIAIFNSMTEKIQTKVENIDNIEGEENALLHY